MLLKEEINEEEMLDIALELMVITDDINHPIASKVLAFYVMDQFIKQNKRDFTEDEVESEMISLYTAKLLSSMVHKGLLEADINEKGDFVYRNSELGNFTLKNIDKK